LGDEQCGELPAPALKPVIPRSSACVQVPLTSSRHSPPPNSHFAMNSSDDQKLQVASLIRKSYTITRLDLASLDSVR